MARLLGFVNDHEHISYFHGMIGSMEGILALISLVVLSISIISMFIFGCVDHLKPPRRWRGREGGGGDGGGGNCGGGGCGGGGGGGGD